MLSKWTPVVMLVAVSPIAFRHWWIVAAVWTAMIGCAQFFPRIRLVVPISLLLLVALWAVFVIAAIVLVGLFDHSAFYG
jgi:hypothetical protein